MKIMRRMHGVTVSMSSIGALAMAGAAIGQEAQEPVTPASSSPAAVVHSDGAIEVPLNAVVNRKAFKAAEAKAAAQQAAGDDRPTMFGYDALIRGGDPNYSFSELNPIGWRPLSDGPWLRVRPLPMLQERPGIGDPGFDPFNTFWDKAQLEFSRAATAGTGASAADLGFARAQAAFTSAAMAGTGASPADVGFARAQLAFSRAAAAGTGLSAADAGFSRAQAQFSRAALAGTGASAADLGFLRAQAAFTRAATAGTGPSRADFGLARAQFNFARAAAAGTGLTPADAGFSRAQLQFSRAAAAKPNPAPRAGRR